MAEPPNIQDLARRFFDLWQAQASSAWAEPGIMDAFSRAIVEMSRQAGGPSRATSDAGFENDHGSSDPPNPDVGAEPSRTAPAKRPSGRGAGGVDKLDRRLAAVEKRLAALEAGTGGGGGKPSKRGKRGQK